MKAFIDTNLSILYVAGLAGPEFIGKHKRLQAYDVADFLILRDELEKPADVVFSPNVLSETSNILRHIREPMRQRIMLAMASLIQNSTEVYIESRTAVRRPEFFNLGLTDAVLLECLSREGGTLYTADLGLYLAALRLGFSAENFNHIRDQRPDFN